MYIPAPQYNRELLLLYNRETGKGDPYELELSVFRSKGRWILDCSDQEALEEFGRDGTVCIPDVDYVAWLQDKLIELLDNGSHR